MPSTWEEDADAALSQGETVIAENDARARHPNGYDDARDAGEYATGCGTMILLALLPLGAALAMWMTALA